MNHQNLERKWQTSTKEFEEKREGIHLYSPPLSLLHHPLNLSILLSGGKENKSDAPSSGERRVQRSKEKAWADVNRLERCSF